MVPALKNAEFMRFGVMHRNTFLQSPGFLGADFAVKSRPNLFFAGQMTGVEGYIESASSGYIAGVNASRLARGIEELDFTDHTVIGALSHFVNNGGFSGNFQPMNANFGIVAPLGYKVKGGKKHRNEEIAKRALSKIESLKSEILK